MRCDVRRYLRYADAGDQFVGRTIALVGFLNSWMFAVLPPHFVEDVTPVVLELFPVCVLMPSMIRTTGWKRRWHVERFFLQRGSGKVAPIERRRATQ